MAAKTKTVFYVSPQGNDNWTGKLPEPSRTPKDGPFATIARARDAIRAIKSKGKLASAVKVLIRNGMYELAETLTFGPDDSGTAKAPITYAAYPGEAPVISGGRVIEGWTIGELNGKPCWRTQLDDVASGKWNFTQLFVNGQRRSRTRRPAEGYYRFTGVPQGTKGMFKGVTAAGFAENHFQGSWHNIEDVDLVTIQHWFDSHLKIKQVDEQAKVVHFPSPSVSDLSDENNQFARFYIENVFEDLCIAGQWYLDRAQGVLHYLPLKGEHPDTVQVVAPRLKKLVRFEGTQYGPKVKFIRLENLDFRYSQWQLPPNNAGAVQGAFNIPGAIILHGAEDCVLFGCSVSRISQYAIEVQCRSQRNRIIGCRMYDLGGGGVRIDSESTMLQGAEGSGSNNLTGTGAFAGLEDELADWGMPNDPQAPIPGQDQAPGTFTEIADCTIRDGGLIYHSAHGVWIGDAGHNYVHHNEICRMNYTAISTGWTWSYCPTFTVANRIEYNHIYDIGQRMMSDLGAIYTLGLHPGSTIKGNLMHDITAYGYGGWGVYPDQSSSYLLIEDNIVYRAQGGGFSLHYGRDNIVRNNIFALASKTEFMRGRAEAVMSFLATNNIIYNDGEGVIGGNWKIPVGKLDRNLYWRPDGKETLFGKRTFEEWQSLGYDKNGMVADPLFADPQSGNFELRHDSPAHRLGFKLCREMAGPRGEIITLPSCDSLPKQDLGSLAAVACRFQIGQPTHAGNSPAEKAGLGRETELNLCDKNKAKIVSLTIENFGKTAAKGSTRLSLTPANAGKLNGPTQVKYDLMPGQHKAISVEVVPTITKGHLFIESSPSDKNVPPSAIMLSVLKQPTWSVKRLDSLKIEQVAAALAESQPLKLDWLKERAADVRAAIAGEHLAVHMIANDVQLEQAPVPWEGSCLEIFGSMEGLNSIGQVVLVPQAPGGPAKAYQYIGGCKPNDDIKLLTKTTDAGYEFSVLVPAAMLKIDPAQPEFLVEFSLSTSVQSAKGEYIRVQAFKAPGPPSSSIGYAKVKVTS